MTTSPPASVRDAADRLYEVALYRAYAEQANRDPNPAGSATLDLAQRRWKDALLEYVAAWIAEESGSDTTEAVTP